MNHESLLSPPLFTVSALGSCGAKLLYPTLQPKHVTGSAQTPALPFPRPFGDRENQGINRCGTCAGIESWGLVKLALLLSQMLSLLDAGDSLSLSPSDLLSHTLIKETRGRLFLCSAQRRLSPHTMWEIRVQSCGAIDASYSVLRVWLSPVRIALIVSCAFCSFRSVRGSSCGLVSKSAGALIAKPVDWLF